MSATNITLGTVGATAGIPDLNVADVPASIRNGDKTAQNAYAEGLAFENVLVNELSQQMSGAMFGGTGLDGTSGTDSLDGSSDSSGLLNGASAYSSLVPQALTSSIMDGGGTGMALEFAQEIDPSLLSADASATTGTDATTATGGTTTGTDATTATGGTTTTGQAAI